MPVADKEIVKTTYVVLRLYIPLYISRSETHEKNNLDEIFIGWELH